MPPHHEQSTQSIAFRHANTDRRDRHPNIDARLLAGGLEAAFCWVFRWRRRRSTVRKLQHLSDHQLKDIGLDRAQVARPC